MNPALSRRVARVMAYEPILSMGLPDALRFPHAVEEANDFSDLPERYQQIILAAEAARERARAERHSKVVAARGAGGSE